MNFQMATKTISLLVLASFALHWTEGRHVNVHCDQNPIAKDSEETETICFIAGDHEFTAVDHWNITNADQFVNATYFKMSSASSNVTAVPSAIFRTFPLLKRIRIMSAIATLPSTAFDGADRLERLEFAKNRLKVIAARQFVDAPKLTEIDLSENRIEAVDDYAFDGLAHLEFLFLQSNRLRTLQRHTFTGAENLRGRQLEDNEIETIEDGAFDLPLLKSLFLGHNKLATLADTTFVGAPHLYGIDLKSNRLKRIGESLYRCRHLGALILDHNAIDDIALQRFARMPELLQLSLKSSGFNFQRFDDENVDGNVSPSSIRFLDMSANGIDDANVLRRLNGIFVNLEELNLERNRLNDINDLHHVRTIFPNISLLELSGNAIECQRLRDIIVYLRRRKITVPRTVAADSRTTNVNGVVCIKNDVK